MLQVANILDNRHFKKAEVIAGFSGLHNIIKWVHVLEVSNVQKLLKGYELILTTGVSFQNDSEQFKKFVEGLIEANCAGLCIEYGPYIQCVPKTVFDLANEHHFPIIVFHEEVPFVEITQDLHSLIINNQYSIISKLEAYSQIINKEALHTHNVEHILKLMHKYLNIQTVYKVEGKEPIFYPNMQKAQREILLQKISNNSYANHFKSQTIHLFEHNYGEIILFSEDKEITEFEMLILDRTVTAVAQLLIRNLYVEEKKGIEDAKWLDEWLEGIHSQEEIWQFIISQCPNYKLKEGIVLLISIPRNEKNKQLDITYFKLFCNAIFDKKGFYLFALEKKHDLILILLNRQDSSSIKMRVQEGIMKLELADMLLNQEIVVGKIVKDLSLICESYQSALDTLYISRKIKAPSYFYDELYIYHLIYKLQKYTNLEAMIYEYLQPLIDFDEKYDGKLLETLEVYLHFNGSKQETAKRLFIVRQTLYHRLKKIESLIGKDFMKGENRLALEFMLQARKFVKKD
ncbi:PucR family transcriptional regulator [Lysinibacillus telephonicus]|uniref:PucR family transcriptional regulator n=1 Tax=Lysinibacillus telephonicus TaxID=1714840 RepID=UPI001FE5F0B3|nr:PucR family transcriptional regulator [Lysinibacillus telephonicus]